jgi:hypothetical protein
MQKKSPLHRNVTEVVKHLENIDLGLLVMYADELHDKQFHEFLCGAIDRLDVARKLMRGVRQHIEERA